MMYGVAQPSCSATLFLYLPFNLYSTEPMCSDSVPLLGAGAVCMNPPTELIWIIIVLQMFFLSTKLLNRLFYYSSQEDSTCFVISDAELPGGPQFAIFHPEAVSVWPDN